jgi:hypothetical protein
LGAVCPAIDKVFVYIDCNRRGGIYGYQLATCLDLMFKTGGRINDFPLMQNDDGDPKINKLL